MSKNFTRLFLVPVIFSALVLPAQDPSLVKQLKKIFN